MKYNKDAKILNDNCLIYYDKIIIGKEIILLQCLHFFCSKCLREWISKNPVANRFCQICKFSVTIKIKLGIETQELIPSRLKRLLRYNSIESN